MQYPQFDQAHNDLGDCPHHTDRCPDKPHTHENPDGTLCLHDASTPLLCNSTPDEMRETVYVSAYNEC